MKRKILAFTMCLAVAMMFGGCGKGGTASSSEVVATVNGEDVTMDEFRYFLIQEASQLQAEHQDSETGEVPDDFWSSDIDGKTAAQTVLDKALDDVTEFHIYKIEADKQGLELTEEDQANIDSQKQSMIDSYGEKMYEAQLKAAGFSEETFQKLMTLSSYSQKLYQAFTETLSEDELNTEAKEYFNEKYLKAKHILIPTQNSETGEALTEDELVAKQATLKEVQDKIASGADFDQLIKEYGEDPGMESNPEGYVFTEGEMVQEFYDGAKALEVGAISEPVESSYGYHIIKREALTDADYDKYAENVKSSLQSEKFMEKLDEYKAAATVEKKAAFDKIDVAKVMEQYQKDYDEASAIIEEEYARIQEEQQAAQSASPAPEDGDAVPEDGTAVTEEGAEAEQETEVTESPAAE